MMQYSKDAPKIFRPASTVIVSYMITSTMQNSKLPDDKCRNERTLLLPAQVTPKGKELSKGDID